MGTGRIGGVGFGGMNSGSPMMAQTMRMGGMAGARSPMGYPSMGMGMMQSPFPMVPYGSPGTVMSKMGGAASGSMFA